MSSPITSTDFDLGNLSGDVCEKLKKLLLMSNKLETWFTWAFDSNGDPTAAFVAAMAGNALPVGSVVFYPLSTIPEGFLLLAGQAISRTTYAALFVKYSTTFGQGDGSTTFNLPDLQGKFLIGKSSVYTIGSTGGAATVVLDLSQIPAHTHPLAAHSSIQNGNNVDVVSTGAGSDGLQRGDTGASLGTLSVGNNTGGGQAHENLPPYFAGQWLVKY